MTAKLLDTTGTEPVTLAEWTFDSASISAGEVTMTIADKEQRQAALGALLEYDCEPSKDGETITWDAGASYFTLSLIE